MTLIEWVSAQFRGTTVAAEPVAAPAPKPESRPRIPAEYLPLHKYLEDRYATTVVLTFDQIEALIGRSLPEIARYEPAWWTAPPLVAVRHSDAWTTTKRTAVPNVTASTVTFERQL